MRIAVFCLILLLPLACGRPDNCPGGASFDDVCGVLEQVNMNRTSGATCGGESMPAVGRLTWDTILGDTARFHAEDMLENNYFSHTGQDGSSPTDRARELGWDGPGLGENIARGYNSVEAVMDGWMTSDGHCRNIMRENYTVIGIGRSSSQNYWVQTFSNN